MIHNKRCILNKVGGKQPRVCTFRSVFIEKTELPKFMEIMMSDNKQVFYG